jgi:hypothetical protein
VYREPTINGYVQAHGFGVGDTLSPQTLPAIQLAIRELFV